MQFDRQASCQAESSNRYAAIIANYPTSRNRPAPKTSCENGMIAQIFYPLLVVFVSLQPLSRQPMRLRHFNSQSRDILHPAATTSSAQLANHCEARSSFDRTSAVWCSHSRERPPSDVTVFHTGRSVTFQKVISLFDKHGQTRTKELQTFRAGG